VGRIVDLSMPLRRGMRGVDWEEKPSLEADGWNARTLKLYSHCATHVDAPSHMVPGGGTLDEVALDALVGPALLIDLTPVEPREELTVERLRPWEDRIGEGARLLLRTDWSARAGRPEYLTDNPRLGEELALWLAERRVALLGVEPHSVGDTGDAEACRRVHRILLEGGVVLVEGLANLAALREEVVEFIALPLRIEGGDGSPVRAVAVEGGSPP
jgi:kynurenine formamidase